MAGITESDEVTRVIVSFVVVDVMNVKSAVCIGRADSAYLAGVSVAFPDLLLEGFCEFVGVNRASRFGETAGDTTAGIGAETPLVHTAIDVGCNKREWFAALLTSQCDELSSAGGVIARLRAILAALVCHLARFVREHLAALFAVAFDVLIAPSPVALARAEGVLESLGVRRRAVDYLAACFAGLVPSHTATLKRTEPTATLCNLAGPNEKSPTAGITDALNFIALKPIVALSRAELTSRRGCLERLAALWAGFLHRASSAKALHYQVGALGAESPSLSAGDQPALALG